MLKRIFKNFLIIIFLSNYCFGQDATPQGPISQDVGIKENLGQYIPLDAVFTDEYGKSINLKEIIDKPTILSLVYYRCPGICSPLLTGLTDAVDKTDLEPGVDYNILTISFDSNEDYLLASGKKENYLNTLKNKKISSNAWRFLTGDSLNIEKIKNAVGFMVKKQGNDFAHGAGIMMISPEGKVVRYLYGVGFLPFDIKMAVLEAQEGKIGPSISKLMKFCFSYDPEGRRYALNVTRIAGAGVLLFIIALFLVLTLTNKKRNNLNISEVK